MNRIRLAKMRFGTRSIVINWMLSYASVLLVPILISGLIYTVTWDVVESEVNRANESVLKQMEQSIDNTLEGIERLSVEMALSKRLAGFIDVEQPLADSDYYDIVGISNDLRVYKMANNYIEQIYVYYKNSDTVVSNRSRSDSEQLFSVIGTEEGWTRQDWELFFSKRYVQEYLPVTINEDGELSKGILYAKSIVLSNPDEQQGAVLLFIMKDSMLLGGMDMEEGATVAVLDKENRLVASTGEQFVPGLLTFGQMGGKNGLLYIQADKQQVAVSYTTSEHTGWKYASLIPAEIFDEKMKLVKHLIYLSMALSVLIGGVVTLVFLKRNYTPISSLVRSLVNRSGVSFETGTNEYGYLQTAFNNTFDEKQRMGQRLEKHRNAIRSHFLRSLLKGTAEKGEPVQESLDAHGMKLASADFAVLLFSVDDYGKFVVSEAVEAHKAKLVHFIILNVVEEVVMSSHQAFTTELDNCLVCIVNFRESAAADLLGIVSACREFMQVHYHVQLTVAVSGIHQGLEGISQAYEEALAALEYRLVMGTGRTIRYEELPRLEHASRPPRYRFPLHVEQQLINFVKSGDYERASALMDEIVDANGAAEAMPVSMAKCLMFDLISTMLKTLDETGAGIQTQIMHDVDPVQQLTSCETLEEMRMQINELLKAVCQSILEEQKQQGRHLSKEIMEYVNGHFQSEDLNVSAIADVFKLTPSYLSKQFKSQTGEALTEYINKTRMEEAKRLLRVAGCSVTEAARRVGYADMNTFNRIFKKYEGITPGKYKEMK